MSYGLQDPCNLTTKTKTYTSEYSERVRLALAVVSAFNEDEWGKFRSAIATPFNPMSDVAPKLDAVMEYPKATRVTMEYPHTTMVRTGPLYNQCPYCGR